MKIIKPLKSLKIILPFVIAIISMIIYSMNINGEFIFDDNSYFIDNEWIPYLSSFDFSAIFLSATNGWGELLPLRDFLYIVQYKFFGTTPTGYHVVSIILYLCSAIVLFFWVKRLAVDYLKSNNKEIQYKLTAWIISIVVYSLFLLHPTYVECVAYISGQKDILSTLFILLSLSFLYIAGRKGSKLALCIIPGILFHYLAIISKLSSLASILFVPIMWWMTSNRDRKDLVKLTGIWIIVFIPVLLWVKHSISISTQISNEYDTLLVLERFPRAINVIGNHILNSFKPWPISFGYPFNRNWAIDTNFFLGLIFLISLAYFFIKKRKSLITLGLLMFIIYLTPVLNIFPDMPNEKVYNRYLAIPLIGLFIAFVPLLKKLLMKSKQIKIVTYIFIVAILSTLGFITYKYVPTYGKQVNATEHTYRYFPEWDIIPYYYVNLLIDDHQFEKAKLLIKHEQRLSGIDCIQSYLFGRISLAQDDRFMAYKYFTISSEQIDKSGYGYKVDWTDQAKVDLFFRRLYVYKMKALNSHKKDYINYW